MPPTRQHRRKHFRSTTLLSQWDGSSAVGIGGTWADKGSAANNLVLQGNAVVNSGSGLYVANIGDYAYKASANAQTTDLTVMLWCRIPSGQIAYQWMDSFLKVATTKYTWGVLGLNDGGSEKQFEFALGTSEGAAWACVRYSNTFNQGNNAWLHYAGVYNSAPPATCRLWINGVEHTGGGITGTPPASLAQLDHDLYIGGHPTTLLTHTQDDVRIYNAALTEAQIVAIYNATVGAHS